MLQAHISALIGRTNVQHAHISLDKGAKCHSPCGGKAPRRYEALSLMHASGEPELLTALHPQSLLPPVIFRF